MNYSPKLRQAMKEVEAVLTKHDIGAMVALFSERHAEFRLHIEPTWSLARYIRKGDAVHIKIHHSKQPQLDWTTGMLCSMRDMAALFFDQANKIIEAMERHAKIDHKRLDLNSIDNSDRENPI